MEAEPSAPNTGAGPDRSLTTLPLGERLEALRWQMAAISSRPANPAPLTSAREQDVLATPSGMEQLLPAGGLAKGSVVTCSGGSLILGMLAAATREGATAAVIGCSQLGWLAAAEMGADLSRLAHIPQAGNEALTVLGILLDGLDIVVLDLSGATVPPSRSRALVARVRSHRSVLVVTGGDWPGSDLRLESKPAAYGGLGLGVGRIQSVHLDVRVSGKGVQPRTGRLVLSGSDPGNTSWTLKTLAADRLVRTG